ncbi:hypothetical protein LNKW23_18180 [Paralimibaculum aggregatum]|uniref:Uncharacterized protein n=1 Tax=Paralimibaculum aggregatum TaxID=3036245 RepID=A0ABQ6LH35_9RHOB|nr:hypothetical protein LNKW23_18180 [Limibaculum sp. NKW23]
MNWGSTISCPVAGRGQGQNTPALAAGSVPEEKVPGRQTRNPVVDGKTVAGKCGQRRGALRPLAGGETPRQTGFAGGLRPAAHEIRRGAGGCGGRAPTPAARPSRAFPPLTGRGFGPGAFSGRG